MTGGIMRLKYFVALLVSMALGCSGQDTTPQKEAPAIATSPIEKKKSYALNKRELKLLDNVVQAEKKALREGGHTMLMSSIPSYASDEIAKTYAENQAAGDAKFFKKSFIVRGTITGILQDLAKEPFLTLNGGKPSREPQVHFSKYLIHKIAALKKGQSAAFACNGGGSVDGCAMLNDCMPLDDYAVEVADTFKSEIIRFLNGEPAGRKDVPLSAVLILALFRSLPENATCFSTGEKCEQEIMDKSTQEKLKQQAPSVKDELVHIGLQIPGALTTIF